MGMEKMNESDIKSDVVNPSLINSVEKHLGHTVCGGAFLVCWTSGPVIFMVMIWFRWFVTNLVNLVCSWSNMVRVLIYLVDLIDLVIIFKIVAPLISNQQCSKKQVFPVEL